MADLTLSNDATVVRLRSGTGRIKLQNVATTLQIKAGSVTTVRSGAESADELPLGTPTDGSFADGLLPFDSTDLTVDAVDDINEVLALIAPAAPGELLGQSLDLSGTTLYSAKLPSGLSANWGAYTPGATISNYIVDGSFNLSTPDPSTRFNTGLISADAGTVTQVKNGSDVTSLPANVAGTSGELEVTDVSTYNSIWRKVNARTVIASSTEGLTTHALRHSSSGQSADTSLYFDDVNDTPSFSAAPSHVVSTELTRFLSGIEYYREGTVFDVDYTAAAGIFRKAYHPTAVSTIAVAGASDVNVNPLAVPAVNDTFAVAGEQITLGNTNVAQGNLDSLPSLAVTLRKPNGAQASASDPLARGINTYASGGSSSTSELFVDELQRLILDTSTPFGSAPALSSGNAQVRNGTLVHPADGDYPALVAAAEYQRFITKVSASNGRLSFSGIAASSIAPFGTGDLNVLLRLDTDAVWFDLGLDAGLNNGDGSGSSRANSKGGKVLASGGNLDFTLLTFSTGGNSNRYRLAVIFNSAAGIQITQIVGS